MPIGGRRLGADPRSVIYVISGDEFSVGQTALEVQEMQELTYEHGAPHKLIEFTCAYRDSDGDAPWHGKPILIRADHIVAVTPPFAPRSEED